MNISSACGSPVPKTICLRPSLRQLATLAVGADVVGDDLQQGGAIFAGGRWNVGFLSLAVSFQRELIRNFGKFTHELDAKIIDCLSAIEWPNAQLAIEVEALAKRGFGVGVEGHGWCDSTAVAACCCRRRTAASRIFCATSSLLASGTAMVSVGRNDGHFVAVGVEADVRARNVVQHDGVHALLRELGARVLQQVLGLGGKADQHRRALAGGVPQAAQIGEDVGVGFEFQLHRASCA